MNPYYIGFAVQNDEDYQAVLASFAKQKARCQAHPADQYPGFDGNFFICECPDDPTVCLLKSSNESIEEARRLIDHASLKLFDRLVKIEGESAIEGATVYLKVFMKDQPIKSPKELH